VVDLEVSICLICYICNWLCLIGFICNHIIAAAGGGGFGSFGSAQKPAGVSFGAPASTGFGGGGGGGGGGFGQPAAQPAGFGSPGMFLLCMLFCRL